MTSLAASHTLITQGPLLYFCFTQNTHKQMCPSEKKIFPPLETPSIGTSRQYLGMVFVFNPVFPNPFLSDPRDTRVASSKTLQTRQRMKFARTGATRSPLDNPAGPPRGVRALAARRRLGSKRWTRTCQLPRMRSLSLRSGLPAAGGGSGRPEGGPLMRGGVGWGPGDPYQGVDPLGQVQCPFGRQESDRGCRVPFSSLRDPALAGSRLPEPEAAVGKPLGRRSPAPPPSLPRSPAPARRLPALGPCVFFAGPALPAPGRERRR